MDPEKQIYRSRIVINIAQSLMLADNMDRWADPVEEILLHSLKGESNFEIHTVSVQWTQRVGPPPPPPQRPN